MLHKIFRRSRAASLVEMGLLVGLIAILLIGSLSNVGSNLAALFGFTENALGNAATGLPVASAPETPTEDPNPEYASCKEWSDAGHSQFVTNGVNPIYPNGASTPINVYCQGAMTLILAQYESDPVTNWNEGIQADYDPTLATKKGFTLSTSEIPSHSKIYFGQDLGAPAYCLVGQYTTGDLPTSTLYSSCDNASDQYYMFRYSNAYHDRYNPYKSYRVNYNSNWENALAIEYQNDTDDNLNWAFVPQNPNSQQRGYSYDGVDYYSNSATYNNSEAWTVWVE